MEEELCKLAEDLGFSGGKTFQPLRAVAPTMQAVASAIKAKCVRWPLASTMSSRCSLVWLARPLRELPPHCATSIVWRVPFPVEVGDFVGARGPLWSCRSEGARRPARGPMGGDAYRHHLLRGGAVRALTRQDRPPVDDESPRKSEAPLIEERNQRRGSRHLEVLPSRGILDEGPSVTAAVLQSEFQPTGGDR